MRNNTQRNLIIAALSSDLGNVTVFGDEPLKQAQAKKLADEGVLVRLGDRTTTFHSGGGRSRILLEITYRLRCLDGTDIADARAMAQRQKHHELQEAYTTLAVSKSAKVRADARKLIRLLHAEQDAITALIRQAA